MFLTANQAKNEEPVTSISDVWKVLDAKLFKNFSPVIETSKVKVFKQHALELFKSYHSYGLFPNEQVFDSVDIVIDDYLKDRFFVPYRVSKSV